jgi:mannose-6-phosphate isomerase-like protein (cupin superfamily)
LNRGAPAAAASPPATVRHPDPAAEYATAERCAILECWNQPADPQASIARARVAPGVTTAWHRLDGITERYLIVAGRGRVEVGDLDPAEVGPGDVVVIPPGCRQRIANLDAHDLVFLAICTPRFVPQAYQALE